MPVMVALLLAVCAIAIVLSVVDAASASFSIREVDDIC